MPNRVLAVLAALACTATAQKPPPPPTSGNGGIIETENGDAIGVVEAQATVGSPTQGKPGYTTYRLALDLANDAANVYTIFGRKGHPMSFPPAFQVPRPFGAHIGGVNPQFFNLQGAAQYAQYDSWLTVGMTNGESTTALGIIGDDVNSWSEAKGLTTEDGAIFWMNPGDGPSVTDANGKAGTGTPIGNIVVAQLTVKSGTSFDARVNCQGHTNHGDNWETTDVKFHVGKIPNFNGAPCTAVQKATVDGCLQKCQRCRSGFDALSTLVVDSNRVSCETGAGELALAVMKAAVKRCPSAPTPPAPPKNCAAGKHPGSKGAKGTVACVPCINNQYKPTAGPSSCLVCPAGSGLVGGNAGPHVDCKPCQGKQSSKHGVVCQDWCTDRPCAPPPTPPPPATASTGGDDGGGSGGTIVVILIILILAVGGVGFAYKQGMLPPALATPIDNILKKTGGSGGATAGGGEGIYSKNVGDGDL